MPDKDWKSPQLVETKLGAITDTGQGASQDDTRAAALYRAAAERGETKAQFRFAVMCAEGTGVPQDDVAAYMWAELAAANALDDLYANAIKLRDHVALGMSAEALAKAKKLARAWRPRDPKSTS